MRTDLVGKVDDTQLIDTILSGDETAFETLLERYQKAVHTFVWRKVAAYPHSLLTLAGYTGREKINIAFASFKIFLEFLKTFGISRFGRDSRITIRIKCFIRIPFSDATGVLLRLLYATDPANLLKGF